MTKRMRFRWKLLGPTVFLAGLVSLAAAPGLAGAAPLWTSLPKPFVCGPGGKIVPNNSCLKHTGFNPNAGRGAYGPWWGQARSSKGNCTAYVAYRLMRNGASNFLVPGQGNAVNWHRHARNGRKAVNGTPAVGAVAWWGANSKRPGVGWAGHVAYVEKVSANGQAVYLSESHYGLGSSRLIVRKGSPYWPQAFLHIKDKPAAPAHPVPTLPPSSPAPSSPTPSEPEPDAAPAPTQEPKPTATTKPKPKPSVTVSKGNSAQGMPGCKSIYCRYIVVKFKNFPSGKHSIKCRASHGSEGGYYTYTRSGTSNTSSYCYYGFPGHTVWVTVDGVKSNKVVW